MLVHVHLSLDPWDMQLNVMGFFIQIQADSETCTWDYLVS